MFTPEERDQLRAELVAAARADPRIQGAALTGSAATGLQDRWSDIDLLFGLHPGSDLPSVLADWTARMYQHGAVHHLDVPFGGTVYRVFLLQGGLQVDLGFAPEGEFGARAPSFHLLFGTAGELPKVSPPPAEYLIGMAWLHAVHARACIGRGKLWQGEYMVSGLRDQVLSLACLRYGLPALQGRGMDRLPAEVTQPLQSALVQRLEAEELRRALRVAVDALLIEIQFVDEALAARLHEVLTGLAR